VLEYGIGNRAPPRLTALQAAMFVTQRAKGGCCGLTCPRSLPPPHPRSDVPGGGGATN
jgi:hypothetical protein